uniref:Ovule protein n=1 Tax=Steinernema glaseri TaxID=37863 RepID=A0A1I7YLE1_9BILA
MIHFTLHPSPAKEKLRCMSVQCNASHMTSGHPTCAPKTGNLNKTKGQQPVMLFQNMIYGDSSHEERDSFLNFSLN